MLPEPPAIIENVDTKESVAVGVRVRPLISRELSTGATCAWSISENNITQSTNDKLISMPSFTFDKVFGPESTNLQVYNEIARPLILSALEGFNVTVFAYGQTASGKTYTMQGCKESPGIIPLTVKDLFSYTSQNCEDHRWMVKLNYVEIYNEEIRDLLNPSTGNLKIKEKHDKQIYIADATEVMVSNERDVYQQLKLGEKNRSFGETIMNDHSSRSHAILTFTLDYFKIEPNRKDSLSPPIKSARINLVDLAGTERVSHTGAEGLRLKEGGKINQSLLTLSNVIQKLASRQSMREHIPYRDSKLTRILEPSLGGNSRTLIICNVTPSTVHIEETLSALKFANRAKNIKNEPVLNETLDISFQEYESMILSLKTQLFQARENPPILARYKKLLDCIYQVSSKRKRVPEDEEEEEEEERGESEKENDFLFNSKPTKKPKLDDEGFEWAIQEVQALAQANEKTHSQLRQLLSKHHQLTTSHKEQLVVLEEKRQVVESLQIENSKFVSELKTNTSAFTTLQENLNQETKLREQLNIEKVALQEKYHSLEKVYSQEVQSYCDTLKQRQLQIEELSFKLSEQQKTTESIHGMFLASESHLKKLTLGLLTEMNHLEKKLKILDSEKKAVEEKLDHLLTYPKKDEESLKTIHELQTHLEELKQSLLDTEMEKEELAIELLDTKLQLEETTNQVSQLSNELEEFKVTMMEAKEAHQSLLDQHSTLLQSIQSLEQENMELKKNYTDSQTKQIELRTLLEDQKRLASQSSNEQALIEKELVALQELQRKNGTQLQEAQLRIKLLESSNTQLQTALDEVKQTYSELLETKKSLEEKCASLVVRSEEDERKVQDLEQEISKKGQDASEIHVRHQSLLNEKQALEEEIEELKLIIESHIIKYEALQEQSTDVQLEKTQLELTLANQTNTVSQLSTRLEKVQSDLQKSEEQLQQAQVELNNLKQQMETYESEKQQWTIEKSNLETQLESTLNELNHTKEDLTRFEETILSLTKSMEDQRLSTTALQDEQLQYQLKSEQQEQILLQLRQENTQLLSELEEVNDSFQTKLMDLDSMKKTLAEKEQQIKMLQQKIEALEYLKEQHLAKLKSQELELLKYQEKEMQLDSLTEHANETTKASTEMMEQLQKELEAKESAYQNKSNQLLQLQQQMASHQREWNEMNEKVQGYEVELEQNKAAMQQLKETLSTAYLEKDTLIKEKEARLEEWANTQRSIESLKAEFEQKESSASHELLALRATVKSQSEELELSERSMQELQQSFNARVLEIESIQLEKQKLESELEATKLSLDQLQLERMEAQTEIDKTQELHTTALGLLEKKMALKELELNELNEKLEPLRLATADLEFQLRQTETSLLQVESDLKDKTIQLLKLENEHEKSLKQMQESLDTLQSRVDTLSKELEAEVAKSTSSQMTCESLEMELALRAEKIKSQEEMIETLKNQLLVSQKEVGKRLEVDEMLITLRTQLEDKEKALALETTMKDELQMRYQDLEASLPALKQLEKDHTNLLSEYGKIEAKNKLFEDLQLRFEKERVDLQRHQSDLVSENAMKTKKIEELMEALQHQVEKETELKKKLRAYEKHIQSQENCPPSSSSSSSSSSSYTLSQSKPTSSSLDSSLTNINSTASSSSSSSSSEYTSSRLERLRQKSNMVHPTSETTVVTNKFHLPLKKSAPKAPPNCAPQ